MQLRALFFLLLLAGQGVYAQSFKGLLINETTYNFGTVKVWDNPPAVFSFENTSFDALYILAPKGSRNVVIEYPRSKIESGEKGEIKVYYYTDKTGNFSEEILVYSSASNEPVKLTVKGQIKAMAENALTQCPTFDNNGKAQPQEYELEGVVVDKITKQPIKNAIVRFAGIESIYTNNRGEFKQKIPAGLYISLAQADGYRDLNLMVGVNKNTERIVYELLPLEVQPLEKDTITPFVDTIRVDTQQVVTKVDSLPVLPDEKEDFTYREYRANNIVFLVDVSGSMKQKGKIDSLKTAMVYMAEALRSVDRISVITFATSTNDLMTNVPGDQKETIIPAINGVQAKGTTNGVLGLERAFATALEQYIEDGNNQVIVVTDGIFNGTNSSAGAVTDLVKAYAARGIVLSVVGFGKDLDAVSQMKKMAEVGNGSYIPFENSASAKPVLIEEIKKRSRRK